MDQPLIAIDGHVFRSPHDKCMNQPSISVAQIGRKVETTQGHVRYELFELNFLPGSRTRPGTSEASGNNRLARRRASSFSFIEHGFTGGNESFRVVRGESKMAHEA